MENSVVRPSTKYKSNILTFPHGRYKLKLNVFFLVKSFWSHHSIVWYYVCESFMQVRLESPAPHMFPWFHLFCYSEFGFGKTWVGNGSQRPPYHFIFEFKRNDQLLQINLLIKKTVEHISLKFFKVLSWTEVSPKNINFGILRLVLLSIELVFVWMIKFKLFATTPLKSLTLY